MEDDRLAESGKLYDDPLLAAYLAAVAARLTPPDASAAGSRRIQVSVWRDPAVCAFALPSGHVYVSTGLLARLGNEAQLAAVLGREIAHVTGGHAVVSGAARAGGRPSAPLGPGLPLASAAAVGGFDGRLEREADQAAMERMVRAGYDPREAAQAFRLLREDPVDPGKLEPCLLGTRAALDERARAIDELWRSRYAGLDTAGLVTNTEEFRRRVRVVVRDNAALDLRAGRFEVARIQLDRALAVAPDDPVTHLYYGDLYRLESQRAAGAEERTELLARARTAYERSAALDPTYADPFRQLGLLYYQSADNTQARQAFATYLTLRPDAPDARRVKEYMTELGH